MCNSLAVTIKAVTEQIWRIVTLILLANDKDPKTYTDSRSRLNAICDFVFVLGLCVLKVILSNTNALSSYLQGKNADVISARRNATLTIKTLKECCSDESYELIWKRADQIYKNIKLWTNNADFFYDLDKDLIEADRRLFDQCKHTKADPKVSNLKTASEVIYTLCKNELLEMVPEFVKVATILAVIPATSCLAERSFSRLRRPKTYLKSIMGEKRLSSIALINIERGYANCIINEDMEKMIDIFGERKGHNTYFFNVQFSYEFT